MYSLQRSSRIKEERWIDADDIVERESRKGKDEIDIDIKVSQHPDGEDIKERSSYLHTEWHFLFSLFFSLFLSLLLILMQGH